MRWMPLRQHVTMFGLDVRFGVVLVDEGTAGVDEHAGSDGELVPETRSRARVIHVPSASRFDPSDST